MRGPKRKGGWLGVAIAAGLLALLVFGVVAMAGTGRQGQRGDNPAEEVQRSAEEAYQEGYAIKERDPRAARARFRRVIELLPAGNAFANKAQKRIDELDGR